MHIRSLAAAFAASVALPVGAAHATDLEVTHWWTSGGEAAAVAEFAKAFDATGNKWVDGAIAGSGSTARPIMISRITGGDPMAATQFNHGRQAEELVEAGLMRDLTDLATAEGWADVVAAPALLESCTLDGKIYCVPVNIHSWQWMWLSNKAFEDAGVPVPTNWEELVAAAPKLREAGKIPLAVGGEPWQQQRRLQRADERARRQGAYAARSSTRRTPRSPPGPKVAKIFEALAQAREMSQGGNVKSWNEATNLVITDAAGAQIMGDWAQGEFQVAGEVAGTDYTCLPGLGDNEIISADGDAFYFPLLDDEEAVEGAGGAGLDDVQRRRPRSPSTSRRARCRSARTSTSTAANDCMKKGLGDPRGGEHHQVDRHDAHARHDDADERRSSPSSSPTRASRAEAAQARFAEIIANAD